MQQALRIKKFLMATYHIHPVDFLFHNPGFDTPKIPGLRFHCPQILVKLIQDEIVEYDALKIWKDLILVQGHLTDAHFFSSHDSNSIFVLN